MKLPLRLLAAALLLCAPSAMAQVTPTSGALRTGANFVLPDARENLKAAARLADNAALAAASIAAYPNGVWRDDYAAGNGAGPLFFTPQTGTCAANSLVNDGGNCVDSTSGDGNSWKAVHKNNVFDFREFGCASGDSSCDAAVVAAAALVSDSTAILSIDGSFLKGKVPVVAVNSSGAASTNATAINNAIQSLGASLGGVVYLPCGNIYVGATIDNNVSNVIVQGCGGRNNGPHYGTNPLSVPATKIIPTFSGEVLKHRTPYNASSKKNTGGGFLYITVTDNSVATTLLDVDSISQGQYDLTLDIGSSSATQAALFQTCVSNTDINDACDDQLMRVNLNVIIGSGSTTDGVVLTGSSNANVSFNREPNSGIDIQVRNNGNGSPFKCVSADNNNISIRQISNAGVAMTGYGPTASHPVGCDQNTFNVSGAVGMVFQGTDTAGVTSGVHNWALIDTANATPVPTLGTGTSLGYTNNTAPLITASDRFLANGTATAPGLSFQSDPTTGIYYSTGQLNFLTAGTFAGSVAQASTGLRGTGRPYVIQGTTTSSCSVGNAVSWRSNAFNGSAASKLYGYLDILTNNCTNGAEEGEFDIGVIHAGAPTTVAKFTGSAFTLQTPAIMGGSAPTASGTCAINTQVGGNQAGSFKANGACAGGTVILTFSGTAPNGYVCHAQDMTTPANALQQTAYTTTSCTLTATMANLDQVVFSAVGF